MGSLMKKGRLIIAILFSSIIQANDMISSQKLGEEVGMQWNRSNEEGQRYIETLREKHSFTAPDESHIKEEGLIALSNDELGKYIQEREAKNPIIKNERKWQDPQNEAKDIYCRDGECFQSRYELNGGFEQVVSHLNTLVEAGKNTQANDIFKGQVMTCNKKGMEFNNCCKETGWGQDLHLAGCTEEEKQLGVARKGNRVIEVGEYCVKKAIGGGCIKRKKVYCVYPSKLAKIVQEASIYQLGKTLGNAKHPLCSSLSPKELQAMNWERIDFSPLYAEIRENTKTVKHTDFESKIKKGLNEK